MSSAACADRVARPGKRKRVRGRCGIAARRAERRVRVWRAKGSAARGAGEQGQAGSGACRAGAGRAEPRSGEERGREGRRGKEKRKREKRKRKKEKKRRKMGKREKGKRGGERAPAAIAAPVGHACAVGRDTWDEGEQGDVTTAFRC